MSIHSMLNLARHNEPSSPTAARDALYDSAGALLLSRTMEREGNLGELSAVSGAPVEIRANPVSRKSRNQSESERRSAGQKRRRKREAKEKENDGRLSGIVRPVNLPRSLAQRARRQRELAGEIEDLLDIEGYKGCHRSRAQTLRRTS
ncbi:hypothetical protein R3P38DRAFT_2798689 [Favolaschia claudopus]|uniref:Uncharacterized protein n=1 Tax=Favolaschia claudopus TaxID=2862362 RepID=A0AAW0A2J8_9AGAR